ncbi:hypothetical protein [Priestia megaterium]|uniref:hypothetical protein n=1 Tax=Priestia megaterium TaxID=1404 RepID=UPI00366C43A1
MKKICLLVFLLIVLYSGKSVHAEVSGEIRHEIFINLQDAYQAQLRARLPILIKTLFVS